MGPDQPAMEDLLPSAEGHLQPLWQVWGIWSVQHQCSIDVVLQMCPGVQPYISSAVEDEDTSNCCRRNVLLDYGNGMSSTTDGFVVIDRVKLPNTHNVSMDASITLEE